MARSATRAPSRGRIHDRNRISAIRAATLRTGLGPYMRVRNDCAPPTSPYLWGHSVQIAEIARRCGIIYTSDGTGENGFRVVRVRHAGNFSVGE